MALHAHTHYPWSIDQRPAQSSVQLATCASARASMCPSASHYYGWANWRRRHVLGSIHASFPMARVLALHLLDWARRTETARTRWKLLLLLSERRLALAAATGCLALPWPCLIRGHVVAAQRTAGMVHGLLLHRETCTSPPRCDSPALLRQTSLRLAKLVHGLASPHCWYMRQILAVPHTL